MDEIDSRENVATFFPAEGDMVAFRFAGRLKIYQQDRVVCLSQKRARLTMLNRFARTPGKRRTIPLAFAVGHHQPRTVAPESLAKLTDCAFRSDGGLPMRICIGLASSHPSAQIDANVAPNEIAMITNNRFII